MQETDRKYNLNLNKIKILEQNLTNVSFFTGLNFVHLVRSELLGSMTI